MASVSCLLFALIMPMMCVWLWRRLIRTTMCCMSLIPASAWQRTTLSDTSARLPSPVRVSSWRNSVTQVLSRKRTISLDSSVSDSTRHFLVSVTGSRPLSLAVWHTCDLIVFTCAICKCSYLNTYRLWSVLMTCKMLKHQVSCTIFSVTLGGLWQACSWNMRLPFMTAGTAAAAPPLIRPGNPALCGSHPLVTPYYCRLGDLLCLFVYALFVYYFVCVCICVFCVFFRLFSFVAFSLVLCYCWLGLLTCKKQSAV